MLLNIRNRHIKERSGQSPLSKLRAVNTLKEERYEFVAITDLPVR